ncbi:hypothetical protein [Sphingobium sp. MK2]|uniref:hypothetical protein n=1 Tax=Sphingobium sp. MK2 TaxID=3116540 RepID=UPI0032E358CE
MSLRFNAPEAKVFGGPRSREYPAPIELLHASIFHTGPGIDELVNFYMVALNMRLVFRFSYPTFEFIAISADDENHRLGFVNDLQDSTAGSADGIEARHTPPRKCRIEHTSWLYRDFKAVLELARAIHHELGIWPLSSRHDGLDLTIDYLDPDGNRVEMLSQTPTKAEILWKIHHRTMNEPVNREYTDTYMAFDMEKMIALYDAGTAVETLMDREWCRSMKATGML